MDARYAQESKVKKRKKLRRVCSLCNEALPDARHFTSILHKYLKKIKQKQYSYTKGLKTLDDKIKASAETEPVIGLEYIYQYAADKRGIVPYVCTLCDSVFKPDTIFFHIVGIKHRSLYLSKNFPAMGIDQNFKARTPLDYRQLLNAVDIVEKSHGRKKINLFNTSFNPKKNVGITVDSDTGGEGLSSSEDEQDNPDLAAEMSGVGDHNIKSFSRWDNVPFEQDRNGGPPLVDVGRGGPGFVYDGRRGPELQDGYRDMNRPLRNYGDAGFQDLDNLPMEFSYQSRGPDSRRVPGMTDFPGDRNPSSQMHRDGMAFHDDRRAPTLQGGPLRTGEQGRIDDCDFDFRQDLSTRSLGKPHSNLDMPSMRPLPQQVDRDDIKGQIRTSHHPPGFSGDHNLQSQMNRGGTAFQYDDRQGPSFEGGSRHADNQLRSDDGDFDFRSCQRKRLLDDPHGDRDMTTMGPLFQQIDRDGIKGQTRTPSHPPNFPGDPNLSSRMNRDERAFQYDDRQGPVLQGGPRPTGNQVRSNDRDFAFQHGQSTRSLGNPHGDLDMPSVGPLHQQVNQDGIKGQARTSSHAPNFPGGHDLSSQMRRDGMPLQYDDRRGPMTQGGPRDTSNQLRSDNRDFAFQNDQSTRLLGNAHSDRNLQSQMHQGRPGFPYDGNQGPLLQGGSRHTDNQVRENKNDFAFQQEQSTRSLGGPHRDLNKPSMGPIRQQVDSSDFKSQTRIQGHPPDFPGDHTLSNPMRRAGMAFQYDDRQGSTLQGGPRHNDSQGMKNNLDIAFQHDQSARLPGNARGDLNMPSMGPIHQKVHRDDIMGQNRTQGHPLDFSGDHGLSSQMHRDGMAFQHDGRREPMSQGGPRLSGNQLRNNDGDFAFKRNQTARSLGNTHGNLDVPSMGPLHQQVDLDEIKGQKRKLSDSQGFSGDRNLQPQMHRGGTAFGYDGIQGAMSQGSLSHIGNLPSKNSAGSDHPRERQVPNVQGDRGVPSMKSFYQQGDHRALEENREKFHPAISGDQRPHSQKHPGGKMHDGRSGIDIERQLRGDGPTFQELKAAHEANRGQDYSGMAEQGVNNDSDMEVRSMDLSDCDPDEFLCNSELFEFLNAFKIHSYEDEQFALKVRDLFANGSIRYKNHKEEALKRRIAEEKEKLEEEKKAFLKVQKKTERKSSSNKAPSKSQAPGPSPSLKPPFPIPEGNQGRAPVASRSETLFMVDERGHSSAQGPLPPSDMFHPEGLSRRGQFPVATSNKPTPLMSIVIDQRPGVTNQPQHSPGFPGQTGPMADPRPPAVPTMNRIPERQSRWDRDPSHAPPEMYLEERFNPSPPRGGPYPSAGHSDGPRNFPQRFPTNMGSGIY